MQKRNLFLIAASIGMAVLLVGGGVVVSWGTLRGEPESPAHEPGSAAVLSDSNTVDPETAQWEKSRQVVAEIEAQKAKDILAEQSMSKEEKDAQWRQAQSEKKAESEKNQANARVRYAELQNLIEKFEAEHAGRELTEKEQVEWINLKDEALDISQRYELFGSDTEEEELQRAIHSMIASGEETLQCLYKELESEKEDIHISSLHQQIFVSESYVVLGKEAQEQWDNGADIDTAWTYMDIQRARIQAEAGARFKYETLQSLIKQFKANQAGHSLTKEEQTELATLQNEALDIARRYDMISSDTEEEKLQKTILMLIGEEDILPNLYSSWESAQTEASREKHYYQIFVSESYVALGKEAQEKWDNGADINTVREYIDTQRGRILAEAWEKSK